MELFDVLKMRQSTRKYSDEQITKEQVDRLLEAANYAPVGSNLYKDLHITVVQDQQKLLKLCEAAWKRFDSRKKVEEIAGDTLQDPEKRPAKPNLFYGAPTVFFISHRKQDLQPGIEWANVMSVASMIHLAATEMGLGSVYMWGALESMRMYPELDHTDLLDMPEDFEPLLGVAVGKPLVQLGGNPKEHQPIGVNYIDADREKKR